MAKTLTATATLRGGMAFDSVSGTGHTVVMDSDELAGGGNEGPRPMEMVLVALAGCTGMDVISLLRKMRQEVTDYQVQVVGNRAEEHPKIYTDITVEHVVRGRGLVTDQVRKAVNLSATRYCPVSAMLEKSVRLTHRYRIVDEPTGVEETGEV